MKNTNTSEKNTNFRCNPINKRYLILAILFTGYISFIFLQGEQINAQTCNTKEANEAIYSVNPKARAEYENFNKFTQNFVESQVLSKQVPYILYQ